MSNQNTGNHHLTIKLIQQNTNLQKSNTLLLEAFKSFRLIIEEIAMKEIHFAQYIKSKQEELNLIFSVFEEINEEENDLS
jgi:vacuolar-type H+-ATPase subunit I/STV1